MKINCPVSLGELIDKMTILKIKNEKIKDSIKREHIFNEYKVLSETLNKLKKEQNLPNTYEFFTKLKKINETLWNIEDKIREKENHKNFDDEFIELARSVYITNDQRFAVKNEINESSNSDIKEIKSYEKY